MMSAADSLPDDVETLKRLVLARDAELAQVRADAASARAEASSAEALIAHQQLIIAKFKRSLFGPRNERKARLLDQMELELEELEAAASEDELAAERAAATTPVRASPAGSRHASRSRRICRASAWSCRARRRASAVAPAGSPSSART
jgi:transposase